MEDHEILAELEKSPYYSDKLTDLEGPTMVAGFGLTTWLQCHWSRDFITPESLARSIRLANEQMSRELLMQAGYQLNPFKNVELMQKLQELQQQPPGSDNKELFDELYRLVVQATIITELEEQ